MSGKTYTALKKYKKGMMDTINHYSENIYSVISFPLYYHTFSE